MSGTTGARVIPGTTSVLLTLARVTFTRLRRGRALWVSGVIALLPVALAAILRNHAREGLPAVDFVLNVVMLLVPTMFVASSVGEELEDRTSTYLWSRPVARWTIIVGKLLALVPIALVLVVPSAALAGQLAAGREVAFWHVATASGLVAIAAGVLAVAAIAASIAVLVPKHGMSLAIIYLVIIDLFIGAMPASLSNISVTAQVRLIAIGEDVARAAVTMAVLAAVWLAIGLWRLRRMEA